MMTSLKITIYLFNLYNSVFLKIEKIDQQTSFEQKFLFLTFALRIKLIRRLIAV